MTLVVPFDDTPLSRAALARASTVRSAIDAPLIAVSVVPRGDLEYARERGWVAPDESFDLETVCHRLRRRVESLTPAATFQCEAVGKLATSGAVATELRRLVNDLDATMVFVGSDRAGHDTAPLGSVGKSLVSTDGRDIVVVRRREPESVMSLPELYRETFDSPDGG